MFSSRLNRLPPTPKYNQWTNSGRSSLTIGLTLPNGLKSRPCTQNVARLEPTWASNRLLGTEKKNGKRSSARSLASLLVPDRTNRQSDDQRCVLFLPYRQLQMICTVPVCAYVCVFHRHSQCASESKKHRLCGHGGVDKVWTSGPELEESIHWHQPRWSLSGNGYFFPLIKTVTKKLQQTAGPGHVLVL